MRGFDYEGKKAAKDLRLQFFYFAPSLHQLSIVWRKGEAQLKADTNTSTK